MSPRGASRPLVFQPSRNSAGSDIASISRNAPSISFAPFGIAKWNPPSDDAPDVAAVLHRQHRDPPVELRLAPEARQFPRTSDRHRGSATEEGIDDFALRLVDHVARRQLALHHVGPESERLGRLGLIELVDRSARLPQPRQPLECALLRLVCAEAEPEHALAGIDQLLGRRRDLRPGRWRLVGVEPFLSKHVDVVVEAERVDLARDGELASLPSVGGLRDL